MKLLKLVFLVALASLAFSATLHATDYDWTLAPPNSGSISDPLNWGGVLPPGGDNFTYIRNGGTATIDADYAANPLSLFILGDGTNNGTVNQTNGLFDLTGGPHMAALIGGYHAGACVGTYNISGGTFKTWNGVSADAGRIYLGFGGGSGIMNVSGGLVQTTGLNIGTTAGGASAINQSGGTVSVGGYWDNVDTGQNIGWILGQSRYGSEYRLERRRLLWNFRRYTRILQK
jgi:hypothetical protein